MTRIVWDDSGSRIYETGVDRGVLSVNGDPGVPWSGLSSIVENLRGEDTRAFYLDGDKYLQVTSYEEFEANISAFTYPEEFEKCEGTYRVRYGLNVSQQKKKKFNLSYRSFIGNDLDGLSYGYKIHIIYNAIVRPSSRTYATVNPSTSPMSFSWDLTTLPSNVSGYKKSAHVIIDSRLTNEATLSAIESTIYGDEGSDSRIPTIEELVEIYEENATLRVIEEDGVATIIGPDEIVVELDADSYSITWPSVVGISANVYEISSQ
jgi:hypothetical protein